MVRPVRTAVANNHRKPLLKLILQSQGSMMFAGAILNVAITVALSCAGVLIALHLSRALAKERARPPLADLHEFERGDIRLTQITRGE